MRINYVFIFNLYSDYIYVYILINFPKRKIKYKITISLVINKYTLKAFLLFVKLMF